MIRYLALEEVLELHRMVLEQSGGLNGVRDLAGPYSCVCDNCTPNRNNRN